MMMNAFLQLTTVMTMPGVPTHVVRLNVLAMKDILEMALTVIVSGQDILNMLSI